MKVGDNEVGEKAIVVFIVESGGEVDRRIQRIFKTLVNALMNRTPRGVAEKN